MSDYTILSSHNEAALKQAVVEHLRRGFLPTGGVSVYAPMGITMYFQAMWKTGNDLRPGMVPRPVRPLPPNPPQLPRPRVQQ